MKVKGIPLSFICKGCKSNMKDLALYCDENCKKKFLLENGLREVEE